jgi:hypothetical protein
MLDNPSIPVTDPTEHQQVTEGATKAEPETATPIYETLRYDEAVLRPRPFTYRDPMSGSITTLS